MRHGREYSTYVRYYDVDLNDIRFGIEVRIPNPFDDFLTGEQTPRVRGEQLEDGVLFGGQVNVLTVDADGSGIPIDAQPAPLERYGPYRHTAAQQSLQPGANLGDLEGFDQMGVGSF